MAIDAGSVRITVDLDASGLDAKLAAVINRAVAPALARAQRSVDGLNRTLSRIDDSGLRKAAAATNVLDEATRRATDALTRGRDERGRFTSAAAGAAADVAAAAVQGRDERGRFTATGRRRGAGTPGGSNQDYGGVLGQINLGWDRFMAKAVLAGSALSTLTPVIGLLGGALGVAAGGASQLIGALGAFGPAALGAFGALKIGFAGLGDAAKEYLKKFDDVNTQLSADIGTMMAPMLDAWQATKSDIQRSFAGELVPSFKNLAGLITSLTPGLKGINTEFAGVANNFTASMSRMSPQINAILDGSKQLVSIVGPGLQHAAEGFLTMSAKAQQAMPALAGAVRENLDRLGSTLSAVSDTPEFQAGLAGAARTVQALGDAVVNLIPNLVRLGGEVGPLFADFLTALGPEIGRLLDEFGQLATAVGPALPGLLKALGDGIAPLIAPLGELGRILADQLTTILPTVGQGLADLVGPMVKALPTFGSLIEVLARAITATEPLITAISQAVGGVAGELMNAVTQITPAIGRLAEALAPIAAEMGKGVADAIVALAPAITIVADAITNVLNLLNRIPGLVEAVTFAFVAWKTIAGIQGLIASLGIVKTMLAVELPAAAGTGAAGIGAQLAAVSVPAWLSFLIAGGSVAAVGSGLSRAHEQGLSPEVTTRFPHLKGPRSGLVGDIGATPPTPPTPPPTGVPHPGVTAPMTQVHPGVTENVVPVVDEATAAARRNLALLANDIKTLPAGEVVLKEDTPEAIQRAKDLGYTVAHLPSGQVQISVVYMYNGQPISREQLMAPIRVPAVPGEVYTGPGRAAGGIIPGYTPGRDTVLAALSGGEGIIIPEAMRALGPDWLYRINSRFRSGLSRRGYQGGGVVTHRLLPTGRAGGGIVPGYQGGGAVGSWWGGPGSKPSPQVPFQTKLDYERWANWTGLVMSALPPDMRGPNWMQDPAAVKTALPVTITDDIRQNPLAWFNADVPPSQTAAMRIVTDPSLRGEDYGFKSGDWFPRRWAMPARGPGVSPQEMPRPLRPTDLPMPPYSLAIAKAWESARKKRGFREGGGVLPGYTPRLDTMLVPLSGGEGIIIPEAMRALGPAWLYGINSRFRRGISRRGYQEGGVFGGAAATASAVGDAWLGLFTQMRDLLAEIRGILADAAAKAGIRPPTPEAGGVPGAAPGFAGVTTSGTAAAGSPPAVISPEALGNLTQAATAPTMSGAFNSGNLAAAIQVAKSGKAYSWGGVGQGGLYDCCLIGETLVSGPAGVKPIAELKPGDEIYSCIGKAAVSARIARAWKSETQPVFTVRTRSRSVTGSANHPFMVLRPTPVGGPWHPAEFDAAWSRLDELEPGDLLVQAKTLTLADTDTQLPDGTQINEDVATALRRRKGIARWLDDNDFTVTRVLAITPAGVQDTYDIEVEGSHNFVADGVVVHNSGFMSDIYAALTGKPYSGGERYFTTAADFTSLGFEPGFDPRSVFNIGVNQEHMAGTLAGVAVESGGPSGGGPVFGAGQGAQQAQFTKQFHLPIGFDPASLGGGAAAGAAPGLGAAAGSGLGAATGVVQVFVTNWPGAPAAGLPAPAAGAPGAAPGFDGAAFAGQIASGVIGATGDVATNVAGDVISAFAHLPLNMEGPRAPSATMQQLMNERNPLALAAGAGFSVQDFTRQGGAGPGMITQPTGPGFDATGRLFSDTAALLDRSFSSMAQQIEAMRKQLSDLLNQVLARLADDVLIPLIKAAVTSAISSLKDVVTEKIGSSMGTAAGPPIAKAVGDQFASVQASGSAQGGGGGILGMFGFDEGGEWPTGTLGYNLSGFTERVLSPAETRLFAAAQLGGQRLGQFGYLPGVSGNATTLAELGGMSQAPFAGGMANFLGGILFSIIDIQIMVRNTLLKLSDDFRGWREDSFKVFVAQGRLLDDTSSLIDRSLSTAGIVAHERARILQQIVQGTLTFLLNEIIVPLGAATASAGVSALAQAAGTATSMGITAGSQGTAGPAGNIAGSFVSGLISGVGNAVIAMSAKIVTVVGDAVIEAGTKGYFEYVEKKFPSLLGGAPSRQFMNIALPNLTGKSLGSLVKRFDGGGMAYGTGLMSKAIIEPERVLSARETVAFERLVAALTTYGVGLMPKAAVEPERVLSERATVSFERLVDALTGGLITTGSRSTIVNAPIQVLAAGPDTAEQVHDRLLALMS